jgi:hypothetical protein
MKGSQPPSQREPTSRKGRPSQGSPLRLGRHAERLLAGLAARGHMPHAGNAGETLIANDLAIRRADGTIAISDVGRAHLARLELSRTGSIDPFQGQHLGIGDATIETPHGRRKVTIAVAESPLSWLARRKARDGSALISPEQLQAGERLRADFTFAQLAPRVTADWSPSIARDRRRSRSDASLPDAVIAARQRVRHAVEAVGPELTGLLLDVCCFLKGLEDVERERRWPPRSAKVVLQLGLDRLARHYGLGAEARGPSRAAVRTWLAPDAEFVVGV